MRGHKGRRSAAGGGGPVLTVAYQANSTSGSPALTIPSSAEAGDFAVLFDFCRNNGGNDPVYILPTGFTEIGNYPHGRARARLILSYRLLTGNDINPTGMNGNHFENKILLVFRPDYTIGNPIIEDLDEADDAVDAPSDQTLTSGSGAVPLIALGVMCNHSAATVANFGTESPAFDRTFRKSVLRSGGGAYGNMRVGYKIYNTGDDADDHTIGGVFTNNTEYLATFYFELPQ